MWYIGNNGTDHEKVGYAISYDGITWTRQNNGDPVFSPSDASWDSGGITSITIFYDENTGIYDMWYTGELPADRTAKIGFATSVNGITWTRQNNGNPVVSGGTGKFDETNVSLPSVLKYGFTYRLWYSGQKFTIGPCDNGHKIGYAISSNGFSWNKIKYVTGGITLENNNIILDNITIYQSDVGLNITKNITKYENITSYSSYFDLVVGNNVQAILKNPSISRSRIFLNPNSSANIYYYKNWHFITESGCSINNTQIKIINKNNETIYSGYTNASGNIPQLTILSYAISSSQINLIEPYTFVFTYNDNTSESKQFGIYNEPNTPDSELSDKTTSGRADSNDISSRDEDTKILEGIMDWYTMYGNQRNWNWYRYNGILGFDSTTYGRKIFNSVDGEIGSVLKTKGSDPSIFQVNTQQTYYYDTTQHNYMKFLDTESHSSFYVEKKASIIRNNYIYTLTFEYVESSPGVSEAYYPILNVHYIIGNSIYNFGRILLTPACLSDDYVNGRCWIDMPTTISANSDAIFFSINEIRDNIPTAYVYAFPHLQFYGDCNYQGNLLNSCNSNWIIIDGNYKTLRYDYVEMDSFEGQQIHSKLGVFDYNEVLYPGETIKSIIYIPFISESNFYAEIYSTYSRNWINDDIAKTYNFPAWRLSRSGKYQLLDGDFKTESPVISKDDYVIIATQGNQESNIYCINKYPDMSIRWHIRTLDILAISSLSYDPNLNRIYIYQWTTNKAAYVVSYDVSDGTSYPTYLNYGFLTLPTLIDDLLPAPLTIGIEQSESSYTYNYYLILMILPKEIRYYSSGDFKVSKIEQNDIGMDNSQSLLYTNPSVINDEGTCRLAIAYYSNDLGSQVVTFPLTAP